MTQTSLLEVHKKPSQAKRMLHLLQKRGKRGVQNHEFITLLRILNYKGRKHELSRMGYDIQVSYTPQFGKGVYTYTLIEEREYGDEF